MLASAERVEVFKVFETFYFGALHHPLWSWASVLVLFACLRGLHGHKVRFADPFIPLFLTLFGLEIALDAWCTGAWTLLPDGDIAQNVAIVFVILGDWRYFVLVERYANADGPASGARPWLIALAWAFFIPILSGAGTAIWPDFFAEARWIFLVYELMFLALACVFGIFVLPARLKGAPEPVRRFVLALTWFEAAQYALWAYADVVILSYGDIGYAFRLIPNAFYYALFLPFVYRYAPRAEAS